MCDEKKFEVYVNRVESLVSEIRTESLQLKEDLSGIKKDVAAVKDDTKDLKRDIRDVKKDTEGANTKLAHINGTVVKHELRIHDMELARSPKYRGVDCPHTETIQDMADSMMSAAVLREYLEQQAVAQKERETLRDRRTMRWISLIALGFSVITIAAMFYIK